MSGSGYRQPYNLPFTPSAAPLQGNSRSDEFNAKRPAVEGAPSFIQVDQSRWKIFDPGDVLTFIGIDPQREMLMLRTSGDKQWCGLYQDLPVPTVVGETKTFVLYTSAFFGGTEPQVTFEQDQRFDAGLLLCEDIGANPSTSFLYANEQVTISGNGNIESVGFVADYIAYDDVGTELGALLFGGMGPMRFRVQQTLVSPGNYAVVVYTDQGNGIGWLPITQSAGGNVLYRQVLLGVRSTNGIGSFWFFDHFRFEELADVEQGDVTTGYAQTLGAV